MINFILKKNKIQIEARKEFTLNKELILEFHLQEKETLTEKEYVELMNRVVKNYSIYLLAKKDYFKKELKNKLESIFYDKKIVDGILLELEEKGYICDKDLVQQYINSHKKYSRKKIEFELILKGIKSEVFKPFLDSSKENEFDEIKRVIEKNPEIPLEKKITSLLRKGFQYKDIKVILDRRGK